MGDINFRQRPTERMIKSLSKVFLDNTVLAIIVNLSGSILEINAEALNTYGWKREELIGQSIKALTPKDRHEQTDRF